MTTFETVPVTVEVTHLQPDCTLPYPHLWSRMGDCFAKDLKGQMRPFRVGSYLVKYPGGSIRGYTRDEFLEHFRSVNNPLRTFKLDDGTVVRGDGSWYRNTDKGCEDGQI